jgi:hypothetical protein
LQRIRRSYVENRFGLHASALKADGRFIGRGGFIRWTIEDISEIEDAHALRRNSRVQDRRPGPLERSFVTALVSSRHAD